MEALTWSRCLCLHMARADKQTEHNSQNGILLPQTSLTGGIHTHKTPALQTQNKMLVFHVHG